MASGTVSTPGGVVPADQRLKFRVGIDVGDVTIAAMT